MPIFTNEPDIINPLPISAVSLPLPTGAATSALQTQPGVDIGDVTINNAGGGAAVNIQDGGNSITIDAVSLPLPTGAATESTLSSIDAGTPAALGSALSAASMPVVIASDQGTIPVSIGDNTTTATVSRVAVSTTVATLSLSNASKKSVVIHNETGTLFVKFGATATSTDYTYRLTNNTVLEITGYAGLVTGIKSAGTTDAQVTEIGI